MDFITIIAYTVCMASLFTHASIDLKLGPDWTAEAALLKEISSAESVPADDGIPDSMPSSFIAGVDEVGRGPLAGPVVAAAVILHPDKIPDGLNDSKKLTAKKRDILHDQIMDRAVAVAVAEVSVAEIDQINILQAAMLAMRQAVAKLSIKPDGVLVDGNKDPQFNPLLPTRCLIKGDGRSLSIAAASIIAKVYRDRLMQKLAADHPGYGWETNAGYGSKKHRDAIVSLGITPHHRRSFSPVKEMLKAPAV